jgi:membrane protease YdiL (CAAX protease family)
LDVIVRSTSLTMNGPELALSQMNAIDAQMLVIVVGPAIETALVQAIPMALLRSFSKLGWAQVIFVSAAVFGGLHISYSLNYGISAFLVGTVLAIGYAARMRPGGAPFLWVFLVHASNNALELNGIHT